MTSKASSSECFVYITLPGEVSRGDGGSIRADQKRPRRCPRAVRLSRQYLEDPKAVEIDPVELKLSKRTYETALLQRRVRRAARCRTRLLGPPRHREACRQGAARRTGLPAGVARRPRGRARLWPQHRAARPAAEIQQDDRSGEAPGAGGRAGQGRASKRSRKRNRCKT